MGENSNRVCPGCGEDRLTEFDPVLVHWHCTVCSETWRTPRGRLVPVYTAKLPGFLMMSLDTELPPRGQR